MSLIAATQTCPPQAAQPAPVVVDTNIVLDLLIFRDPATPPLQSALDSGQLQWLATAPMREELARVLTYPAIVRSMVHHTLTAEQVLAAFDVQARLVPVAPKARVTCKDPDDQKFLKGEPYGEDIVELCQEIIQLQSEIAECKETIANKRGKNICPACGASAPREADFCMKCGSAIPKPEETEDAKFED